MKKIRLLLIVSHTLLVRATHMHMIANKSLPALVSHFFSSNNQER